MLLTASPTKNPHSEKIGLAIVDHAEIDGLRVTNVQDVFFQVEGTGTHSAAASGVRYQFGIQLTTEEVSRIVETALASVCVEPTSRAIANGVVAFIREALR